MTAKRILQLVLLFIVVEAVTAGILAAYTQIEIRKEKYQTLLNTITAARFMALVPTEYTRSYNQALYDTGYASLMAFLANKKDIAPWPDISTSTMHTLYIKLLEDLPPTPPPEVRQVLNGERTFAVNQTPNTVSVAVPLIRGTERSPYGVLRIETQTAGLLNEVLWKNASLYLLIIVLVNGQVIALLVLLSRKPQPLPFERGYLKEHALGALKLQHKILGDIIADHEDIEYTAEPPPESPSPTDRESHVIPLTGKPQSS